MKRCENELLSTARSRRRYLGARERIDLSVVEAEAAVERAKKNLTALEAAEQRCVAEASCRPTLPRLRNYYKSRFQKLQDKKHAARESLCEAQNRLLAERFSQEAVRRQLREETAVAERALEGLREERERVSSAIQQIESSFWANQSALSTFSTGLSPRQHHSSPTRAWRVPGVNSTGGSPYSRNTSRSPGRLLSISPDLFDRSPQRLLDTSQGLAVGLAEASPLRSASSVTTPLATVRSAVVQNSPGGNGHPFLSHIFSFAPTLLEDSASPQKKETLCVGSSSSLDGSSHASCKRELNCSDAPSAVESPMSSSVCPATAQETTSPKDLSDSMLQFKIPPGVLDVLCAEMCNTSESAAPSKADASENKESKKDGGKMSNEEQEKELGGVLDVLRAAEEFQKKWTAIPNRRQEEVLKSLPALRGLLDYEPAAAG